MILGMRAEAMAGFDQLANAFRIGLRHAADDEEGRLNALRGEDRKNLAAVARQRTVVKRQYHLVIPQWQGFGILHGPDAGMLAWVDHQRTRSAKRIAIAGALGGPGRMRSNAANQAQAQNGPLASAKRSQGITDHKHRLAFRFCRRSLRHSSEERLFNV